MTIEFKIIEVDAHPEGMVIFNNKDIEKHFIKKHRVILTAPDSNRSYLTSGFMGIDAIEVGTIGISEDTLEYLKLEVGSNVEISLEIRQAPESYRSVIKKRMKQKGSYSKEDISLIVNDIVQGKLSSLEQSAFLLDQYYNKLNMNEIEHLTRAMANTGEILNHDPLACHDKHSLGGVPGNKVTLLIVPIIAAAGLLIPKTSSRAITSPSGTADTMEAFGARISFNSDEILEISKQTKGMIVWGGALNLAPADDILISEVEYPLGINPQSQMIASIMAKKVAMGVEYLVLDLPVGEFAKVANVDDAMALGREFAELGHRLGIRVESGLTFASIPVGHAIGPALEAREGLSALMEPELQETSSSLVEKSCSLAGILLEMSGIAIRGQGSDKAKEILYSGQAYKKFQEILEAQEGDPNIKPEDIPVGKYYFDYIAQSNGYIVEINNKAINQIAKAAGAPADHGSGIKFLKKKDPVNRGEPVFRVYARNEQQLKAAQAVAQKTTPITIEGMLLGRL